MPGGALLDHKVARRGSASGGAVETLMRAMLLLAALTLASSSDAVGQEQPAPFCLWARPATQCRTFLVTEFGAYVRLDRPYRDERRYLLTGNLGIMLNLGAADAAGVFGYLSAHGVQSGGDFLPDITGGVAARYRHSLSASWGVDLTVGGPIPGVDRYWGTVRFPSAIVELRATMRDLVGFSVRWEPTRYEYQLSLPDNPLPGLSTATLHLTKHQFYVGAQAGGLPGAVAMVLGWAAIAVGWWSSASS